MIGPLETMEIRVDKEGSGKFATPRGWKIHQGNDLVAIPDGIVRSPVAGKLVRIAYPYGQKDPMRGLLIKGKNTIHKLMYCVPADPDLIGKQITEGQEIAVMQNVQLKYGDGMIPHLHWEIIVDPSWAMTFPDLPW